MTDMNEMSPRLRQDFFARVSENSKKILWTGIAMVVVGLIAIIFPFIASVAVTLMAGILFLITGFVTLSLALQLQTAGILAG